MSLLHQTIKEETQFVADMYHLLHIYLPIVFWVQDILENSFENTWKWQWKEKTETDKQWTDNRQSQQVVEGGFNHKPPHREDQPFH